VLDRFDESCEEKIEKVNYMMAVMEVVKARWNRIHTDYASKNTDAFLKKHQNNLMMISDPMRNHRRFL